MLHDIYTDSKIFEWMGVVRGSLFQLIKHMLCFPWTVHSLEQETLILVCMCMDYSNNFNCVCEEGLHDFGAYTEMSITCQRIGRLLCQTWLWVRYSYSRHFWQWKPIWNSTESLLKAVFLKMFLCIWPFWHCLAQTNTQRCRIKVNHNASQRMEGKDHLQNCRILKLLGHLGRVHWQPCYTVIIVMSWIRAKQVFSSLIQPTEILLSAF